MKHILLSQCTMDHHPQIIDKTKLHSCTALRYKTGVQPSSTVLESEQAQPIDLDTD